MIETIQLRRDLAANWTSVNPVLAQCEAGVETDTGKAKLGDGATAWESLPYWNPSGLSGGGGGGAVASVFGRSGAVTAQSGDYTAVQVGADASGAATAAQGAAETYAAGLVTAETSRAEAAETANASAVSTETSRAETAEALKAPLASPALTGNPTAPTQTTGDSSTKIATDAFVGTAVAAETTRAEAAEALLLPLSGGTLTGPLAVEGALTTPPVTLTDASSIAVNAALSDYFRVTLGGNRTLANPTGLTDGQTFVVEVIQDSTGSRTLAYGSAYSFPASIGTPALSSTPGYHDFLAFRYNASDTTCYCTGFVPQSVNAAPASVAQGGTGDSSLTAYALLAGGTTSTGAVQSLAGLGSSGQVLTSNGASALPTFQPSASGFSNPMTTLGDLIYENSTPAAARLAGQTTAAKNFLTQTGTGSVSAAPAWGAIASGDLPAATTSAKGAVILDGTASDITQTGTANAAGSVGEAADSGHTHANSLAIPGDFSFAGWTLDPAYCNAAGGASTSVMYLTRFFLRQATTLNDVWLHVVTAPVGTLTSGQNFACVYDSGGTQRAITADQTTAWGTTGVKEAAFTSSYAAPAGWYYFVLNVVVSGGAGPAFRAGATAASAFLANAGLSAATLRVATQTAVAGTPGALTLSSNVQTSSFPICAVFV